MTVSPISPRDPSLQAQTPTSAAPAPGNSESAGGVISQLQKLIEEFKKELEKGNISLTEMNKLVNIIAGLQNYMAELQNGTLTVGDAAKMLDDLKSLYQLCNGPNMPKGAAKIWTGLAKAFDAALNGGIPPNMANNFSQLLEQFMQNPSSLSTSQFAELALKFQFISYDTTLPPPENQVAIQLAGAFAGAIDQTMSAGDNLSQQLSTLISQITNMIEELAKAQGQIEQKFYQTLMQQIKLAQP